MTQPSALEDAQAAFGRLALLIDGHWTHHPRDHTEAVHNPADGSVLGVLPHASAEQLDQAARAAARAFPGWSQTPSQERRQYLLAAAALLRQRQETLAHILTLEQGKPLAESRGEITAAIDIFEWYAEETRRLYGRTIPPRQSHVLQTVEHHPIGPVAAFTPWNFPALTPARKIAGALAAGCTLVLKPAEETPATALALAGACMDAGVPPGVLNVVFGVPHEVSDTLIRHPDIRKITFTGSIPVGKQLAQLAASHGLKPCTLELGGHAPVIVCRDADIAAAAQACAAGRFRNAGQVCVAPSRFFVDRDVHDEFVDGFRAAAQAYVLGNGLDASTTMGPMANARRVQAMQRFVADAQACGATVQAGAATPDAPGHYFSPTVVSDLPDSTQVMQEEIFGPIAPVTPFETLDEALTRANALPFGLAAYGFTRSARVANTLSQRLNAGLVGINHFAISLAEAPFGGQRESGYGSEGGQEGLHAYLTTRFVSHLLL